MSDEVTKLTFDSLEKFEEYKKGKDLHKFGTCPREITKGKKCGSKKYVVEYFDQDSIKTESKGDTKTLTITTTIKGRKAWHCPDCGLWKTEEVEITITEIKKLEAAAE